MVVYFSCVCIENLHNKMKQQAALLNQQRCAFGLSFLSFLELLFLLSLASMLRSSSLVNGFELLPIGGGVLVDATTITWGYANKYAKIIHEEEVIVGEDQSNNTVDVDYPSSKAVDYSDEDDNDSDSDFDYTITSIHVYTYTNFEKLLRKAGSNIALTKPTKGATTVEVISGGIGQNKTVIRFERLGDEGSSTKAAYHGDVRFKLVIYGVDF